MMRKEAPQIDRARIGRLFAAVLNLADRSADVVAAYLKSEAPPAFVTPDGQICITRQATLELAAILQIAAWERAGLSNMIPVDLPTAENALADLMSRISIPSAERTESQPTLMLTVFVAWVKYFAWYGPGMLGADVVVDGFPANLDLEEIADYLWNHRQLAE